MSIKAVIFDLDGTITRPFFNFDAIREEMGLDKNSGPILESMQKMSPRQRKDAEKILHYHEQQAVIESKLNDGAGETLESLCKAKIKIGILTRNKRSNALAIAKKHGLHFDAVIDRDDGPVKPDAFGILRICEKFGIKPEEALMVGDYLFDLQCASSAGAIAVLLTNHEHAHEFAEHADFCIERIDQILEIIKQSENRSKIC
jgi:HAD superfamily hydrolase (TIGR01509 family)